MPNPRGINQYTSGAKGAKQKAGYAKLGRASKKMYAIARKNGVSHSTALQMANKYKGKHV